MHRVAMAGKTMTEVFEQYYQGMLYCFPMKDVNFVEILNNQGFLPAHMQATLESLDKSIERASYFLDYFIKPDLDVCFDKLLTVMIESGYDNLRDLATKMKSELFVDNNTQPPGNY